MQKSKVFSLLAATTAAALTVHSTSASSHRSLRYIKPMGSAPEWNPATILDSSLDESVKICVRAYESEWGDTLQADDIDAAQQELFHRIYANCVTPATDTLHD